MAKHQKFDENPLVVRDKKRGCNFWLLLVICQVIVVIFLVLAVFDVFSKTDTSSDSDAENSTSSTLYSNVLDGKTIDEQVESDDGDSYLTGDVAPNMIFLLADDIGWADISHNNAEFSTPNIDSILEDGLEFTRFYSHALCTPSRMAFLTGRYAWKLGSQYAEVIHGMMAAHIPSDEITYAEVTKSMGYDNYYVGRWGVGYASWDFTPLGRGWDKFMGYFGPESGYYNHSTDHFAEWLGVYDMWDMKEPFIDANMTYSEDLFLDRTLEYLEEAKLNGKPFTLTYASQTAHAPIDDDWPTFYPPTTWSECVQENVSYIGREYFCNKVKYLDYVWGIIIDYLKSHDMWDNTLIFMTTDNGALPYTHETTYTDWGCNWPLRSGKVTNYEGGIKVWAGLSGGLLPKELRGTTFDGLAHIVDFATTAMRLSMTKSQYEARTSLSGTRNLVDGVNLFNLEYHDLIIHYVLPHYIPSWMPQATAYDYAATDGEYKYYVGFDDTSALAPGWYNIPEEGIVTGDNYPHVFANAGGYCKGGCLFHLATDPNEYHDISKEYPEITLYYEDLINAIYAGGFDEDYHSGQSYEEDYRGYQADNILRPYLIKGAVSDYAARMSSVNSTAVYDYAAFPLSWDGDYDGVNNPFDSIN